MGAFATPMGDGGGISEAPPTEFLAELDAAFSDTGSDTTADDPGPVDEPGGEPTALEDETSVVDEPAGDEPPIEDEPAADSQETSETSEEPTAEAEAAAATDPNLPEGVRAYERHGKKFMSVPQEVWERTFSGFQGVQALEEVIGEPLTKEALQARQDSHDIRAQMREDYVSADPDAQANFIMRFLGFEAQRAVNDGEVQVNPLLSFAGMLPQVLRAQYPEAYQQLESTTLRASLDALYVEAGRMGLDNKDAQNLLYSVQRIDKAKFGDYKKADQVKELAAKSPNSATPDEVSALRAQIAERDQRDQQTAYKTWFTETNKGIGSSIDGVISEKLNNPAFAKAYKPEDLKDVRAKLHDAVTESLKAHAQWNNDMARYLRQAQRAATPTRRDAIRQAMAAQATNIGRRAIEAKLPQLLSKLTKRVVDANKQLHDRRAAGSQQRSSGTPGTPGTKISTNVRTTRAAFSNDSEFMDELNRTVG